MKKWYALPGFILLIFVDLGVASSDIPRFLTLPFYDRSIQIQQAWTYTWAVPHDGLDYIKGRKDLSATWESFDVIAAASGKAVAVEMTPAYGNSPFSGIFVYIYHDKTHGKRIHYFSLYGHLEDGSVNPEIPFISLKELRKDVQRSRKNGNPPPWEHMERGEFLGRAGETGAEGIGIHLHFEVQRGGYGQGKTDPYDIASTIIRKNLATREYYPGGDLFTSCGASFLWTECPPLVPTGP